MVSNSWNKGYDRFGPQERAKKQSQFSPEGWKWTRPGGAGERTHTRTNYAKQSQFPLRADPEIGVPGDKRAKQSQFGRTGYPSIPLFHHSSIPIRCWSCETKPIPRGAGVVTSTLWKNGYDELGLQGRAKKQSQFAKGIGVQRSGVGNLPPDTFMRNKASWHRDQVSGVRDQRADTRYQTRETCAFAQNKANMPVPSEDQVPCGEKQEEVGRGRPTYEERRQHGGHWDEFVRNKANSPRSGSSDKYFVEKGL